MRRQHPFISLPGFALAILFLIGLGFSIWLYGGQAFSPGGLSAVSVAGVNLSGFSSHAEFEGKCSRCHDPLRIPQDVLCLDCHKGVADQIAGNSGFHSQIDEVERCAGCHTEHRGREFNLGMAALKYFNHDQVAFSLIKHQTDYAGDVIICTSCHHADERYSDSTNELCASCHGLHAPGFMTRHIQDYGANCQECHDGRDRMVNFDHTATTFPLAGRHTSVRCIQCHAGENAQAANDWAAPFRGLSAACSACHEEPPEHRSVFDSQCEACHTEAGWLPAALQGTVFDHSTNTRFALARHRDGFDGQPLTCMSCHGSQLNNFNSQVCADCHSAGDDQRAEFMHAHIDQFGEVCLDCHDGFDRMVNFDHAQVFPLEGVHGEINCESCHVERVYQGTPRECVQCHAEPAIHAGVFGINCQDCHTPPAWTPARLRVHDFPLDHGEKGEVACITCHQETYTSYTCYGCHDHQPGPIEEKHAEENVALEDLANCTSCHPDGK